MVGTTDCTIRPDGIAVLTLNNAPVNSLSSGVVSAFNQHFKKLEKDPKVKAIVLTGHGKMYCGGFAIDEFATAGPAALMALQEMINGLDNSSKPTVAAINGEGLGGGFETTMACHYRVAVSGAKCGLPEVMLGLLPGGQGTQRLPRLAPMEVLMPMLLSGASMPVEKLNKVGVIDKVMGKGSKDSIVDFAAEYCLNVVKGRCRPVSKMRVPIRNMVAAQGGALDTAELQMSKVARGFPAPLAIIKCVRAACLSPSFEQGLQVEQEEFGNLLMGKESGAMINIFFAIRNALKVKGIDTNKIKPTPIKKVGIIGAGLMGGGITMCFIKKNIPVVLKDAKQEWLTNGVNTIRKNYDITVKKGKMKEERMKQLMGLIKPTIEYEDLKDCDLIIEAVPEIMPLKKEMFTALSKVGLKESCLVCTNTSGLDIDEIARSYKYPEKVMGTHFFSPANVMQLLENVKTAKASPVTLATCMLMGKLIGKKAVLVGNCDGFVGNRMLGPYGAEARIMIELGAAIEAIDNSAGPTGFGMPMGPICLGDLVGHELFWNQRKAAKNDRYETKVSIHPFEMTDWLCDRKRYGIKTGRGVYLYDAKTRKKLGVDPEVKEAVNEIAKKKGITDDMKKKFDKKEIVERLFYPLVNEGFKILEENMSQRPSDIDVVYAFGYGFPIYKGGPMYWADNIEGLDKILDGLKKYGKEREELNKKGIYRKVSYWEPSKLLVECVEKKTTLTKLWAKKEKEGGTKL